METKNIDIVKLLREYNQNPENKSLKALYSGRTIFDIIGKGRNETAHSAFLEWLFSGRDISGTSTENTLIGLLDAVMRRIDEQDRGWRQDDKIVAISNALLSRTLKITNIKSETEKPIPGDYCTKGKKDSIDIFISCDVRGIDKICRFEFIIENKIGSKEGGPKDEQSSIDYDKMWQTERYYKACSKDTDDTYQFFIYLSAATDTEIASRNKQCKSEYFICINYQDIYDDILSQLLESDTLTGKEEYLIKEYVKVLSIPMVFGKDDIADKDTESDSINKSIILATSKEERELLLKYWKNNQLLILIALQAYEDGDEDNEKVKHDWSRYIDDNGNLYTKVEYIQNKYDEYKKAWQDNDFRKQELCRIYLKEFNNKFGIQKKGKYLKLIYSKGSLIIEVLNNDRDEALNNALHTLGITSLSLSSQEKEAQILQEFNSFCAKKGCEESFNKKIKDRIKGCKDFIDNGKVKNNSKFLKEICEECSKLTELLPNVKILEYPKDGYQEVLSSFWDVNKSLIMASARVLSDSHELSETTNKGIKDVYDGLSRRDWTRYNVTWKGKTITTSALGVFKFFVQSLLWPGTKGQPSINNVNKTLNNILNKDNLLQSKKGSVGSWEEIKKPNWVQGSATSYFLNKGNYKSLFDNYLYPHLCDREDYEIEKQK